MSKWKTLKVRDFAHTTSGGTPSTTRKDFWENGTIPWINSGELSQFDFIQKPTTLITEKGLKYSSAKLFPQKTVGIALTGATTGMVAHFDIETTTNQSIVGIFPNETLDSLYLFYYLKNNRPYILSFNVGSAQEHINKRIVDSLDIYFPEDLKEQSKIARILFTIDRAIAQTEALIAKHQRIKTGLMQDLLTRGIDEHGELRDLSTHRFKSTPLGMIPEGWEVGQLSQLADCIDPQPDHRAPAEVPNGEPYIGVGDYLSDGTIDFANCRKVSKQAIDKQAENFSIETGDIIFGKIGTIGLPRKLVAGRYGLSANTVLIKPKKIRDFVYWVVNSENVDRQVKAQVHSTSQPAFGIQKVRALLVPIPLEPEQEKISEKINAEDGCIKIQRTSLEKLKSIKAGLMQDLLSGRVSVKALMER